MTGRRTRRQRAVVASPTLPEPSTASPTPAPSPPPTISAAFQCTNRVPVIPYDYFFPEEYLNNPDRYKEQPQRDEDTITAEITLNHISRMDKLPPLQLQSLRQVPRQSTKRRRGRNSPDGSTTTSTTSQEPTDHTDIATDPPQLLPGTHQYHWPFSTTRPRWYHYVEKVLCNSHPDVEAELRKVLPNHVAPVARDPTLREKIRRI